MTDRERMAYLTGLGHGFKMMPTFLELNRPAEEIKDFVDKSMLKFFQAMGLAKLSDTEEAEFAQVLDEISEIVESLLRPPGERN